MLKFPKCYFCKEFNNDADEECCSQYPEGIPSEIVNADEESPCPLFAIKNESTGDIESEDKFSKRLLDIIGF